MSSIPYNSKAYLDAKVSMADNGTVDAGRQMQSPASAGSRGLAKTMTFSKDKTQMQMGREDGATPIAESMVEIQNILSRIDGICVPVSEDDGDERAIAQMKTDRDSDYLYLRGKEIDQGSIMYKMEDYSDGIFELQSAKYADGTELDEKELEELESTQELIDWVMIDFVSESAVQEDDMQDMTIMDIEAQLGKINDEITFLKIDQKDKESALAALGALRTVLDKYQSQKESAVKEDAGDEQKWMNYAKFWKFVNEIFKAKAI